MELQLYTELIPCFMKQAVLARELKYPADHGVHKLTETDELLILGFVLEGQKLACMIFKGSCKL